MRPGHVGVHQRSNQQADLPLGASKAGAAFLTQDTFAEPFLSVASSGSNSSAVCFTFHKPILGTFEANVLFPPSWTAAGLTTVKSMTNCLSQGLLACALSCLTCNFPLVLHE